MRQEDVGKAVAAIGLVGATLCVLYLAFLLHPLAGFMGIFLGLLLIGHRLAEG